MTWWATLVTAGWGPVSYLEMLWLALTAWTTYYLVGELRDACGQRGVAEGRVERWIADGAYYVELKAVIQQGAWGLIGVVSALAPPPPDAASEPRRVLSALVVTAALMGVQVSNLLFARYRRANRLRITAALAEPPDRRSAVPGGRRRDDPPAVTPWADEG